MISKNFVLILLATILTLSFASALTIGSYTFGSIGSSTVNVGNDYNESLAISVTPSVSSGYSFIVSPTTFNLANGSSQSLSISLTGVPSGLTFGSHQVATLTATSNTSQNSTSTIYFLKSFCDKGTVNESNLSIRNIDISNNGNGDDNEWDLLDTVTVDVEIEVGDTDLDNVQVEMGLYDSTGKNVVNDLDFTTTDEETVDLGDLNDGDKETATFEFKVPADIDPSNYKLVFKTYSTQSGVGESVVCDDTSTDLSDTTYESISINEASDKGKYIVFDDTKLTPSEVTCGDSVAIDSNVFNVGKNDEDKVKIHLINSELGIDQVYEMTKGLNQGDNARVSFAFAIPSNALSKTYSLRLSSEYDYRNGIYRQESDDDTIVNLKVIGCSASSKTTGITVSSDDSATAGTDYTVTATIKNLGTSSATFNIDASNYESWAELSDVSDSSLTLAAGQSKDVTLTFKVKPTASGDNVFNIVSVVNGKTETKEVQVSVGGNSGLSSMFKGNSLVWVIGLVNLILIILIIIVAVKVARR